MRCPSLFQFGGPLAGNLANQAQNRSRREFSHGVEKSSLRTQDDAKVRCSDVRSPQIGPMGLSGLAACGNSLATTLVSLSPPNLAIFELSFSDAAEDFDFVPTFRAISQV